MVSDIVSSVVSLFIKYWYVVNIEEPAENVSDDEDEDDEDDNDDEDNDDDDDDG